MFFRLVGDFLRVLNEKFAEYDNNHVKTQPHKGPDKMKRARCDFIKNDEFLQYYNFNRLCFYKTYSFYVLNTVHSRQLRVETQSM
jgi:hypothetical protein